MINTSRATMECPLQWPKGRARTSEPENSRFKVNLRYALEDLISELERMGADYITITCNMEGRVGRGDIWRPYSGKNPTDPGVAIYFNVDKDEMAFSCDRWTLIEDNVRAIGLTIAAMRGIERWGSSETVKQAFEGFRNALPAAGIDWRSVFGVRKPITLDKLKVIHREMAFKAHPDRGGNQHDLIRINQAWEAAKAELSAKP